MDGELGRFGMRPKGASGHTGPGLFHAPLGASRPAGAYKWTREEEGMCLTDHREGGQQELLLGPGRRRRGETPAPRPAPGAIFQASLSARGKDKWMPSTYLPGPQVCVAGPPERTQASEVLVATTPAIARLLFLAAAAATALGKSEFLTIVPAHGDIYLGSSHYFICKGVSFAVSGGEVEARLRWLGPDGEEVALGGSSFSAEPIDEASVGLRVTLSEPGQGGLLKCVAEPGDTEEEEILEIRAIERPHILSLNLSPTVAEEGSVTELQCKVTGISQPNITWEHQGLVLGDKGE
ncbi:neural cell adhesion molecule 1-like [Vombatus ursinus]|uniref:neural cell adhesion molecule 1-like n=1 Tax=Vombatus ursinus TaxID=29139 RepID=UPI000FFD4C7F|nr:neural cell adhesion molecule 1-like [Vombatus ursinus]